jgi:hypothetical protein
MRSHVIGPIFLILMSVLAPGRALALGPYLNYSGRLLTAAGEPAKDAAYPLTFAIYDKAQGGEPLWSEQQYATTQNGLYSVLLGAVQPIEFLEESKPLYLAIAQKDEDITKVERATIVFLVPNGIDTAQIKDGAVTPPKLAEGMGMRFVYNDFADSSTSVVGEEVTLKRYIMPANTLKKGMLVNVTGQCFAFNAALTLYVNGRPVKSVVQESNLTALIRVGFGGISARLTGLSWDSSIIVEVRGIITSEIGRTLIPQEITCSGLTIMGD